MKIRSFEFLVMLMAAASSLGVGFLSVYNILSFWGLYHIQEISRTCIGLGFIGSVFFVIAVYYCLKIFFNIKPSSKEVKNENV